MGSLALRPGNSLTVPKTALSVSFTRFVSSTNVTQATGLLTLAPVGLTPTEHASLRWTHSLPRTSFGAQTLTREPPRVWSGTDSPIRGYEVPMLLLRLIWAVVHALFTKRADLVAENLALRQQLIVLHRKTRRPRLKIKDRVCWL